MNVKIMQWNCRGLAIRKPELQNFLNNTKTLPDVICVEETFLKPTNNFFLHGYEIVRQDRVTQQGGGLATLIRSGIKYNNIDIKFNKIEAVAVELHLKQNTITVINVYDPPDRLVDMDDYRQLFGIGGRVIVTGDFNAHHPLWKSEQTDRRGECIEVMLDSYDFALLNTGQPTHQNNNGGTSVLDLSFTCSSLSSKCEWSVDNNTLGSDHCPTFVT